MTRYFKKGLLKRSMTGSAEQLNLQTNELLTDGWVEVQNLDQTPVEKLKIALTARRYEKETGGILWNGWPVKTTLDSKGRILGAYNRAKEARWAPGEEFIFADGAPRVLTAADMIALYIAVENHVQACFGVYAAKIKEIDATGTTNLETGWPA